MIESDIASSLNALKRQSRASLVLVLLGAAFLAFSLYYSASRLTPLENEVTARQRELRELNVQVQAQQAKLDEQKKAFETLRANTQRLYSVRVTPANQVYEVKATAIATGRVLASGTPEYRFSIFINSPPETLQAIHSVVYRMDHPTFSQKDLVSDTPSSRFAASYIGWGCLNHVSVTVLLKSGATDKFDFDMCKSLGPAWG